MKLSTIVLLTLFLICFCFTNVDHNVYGAEANQKHRLDFTNITFIKTETERDMKLEEAFSKVYDLKQGEDRINYYYNRIDLNNDNNPETFVYLSGPYVCGTGGCSGLIFQEVQNEYKLVSQFSLVRTPIIISNKATNGWKDIIMYVAGGGITPSYKKLKFNGETYPSNPSIQPDINIEQITGIGIISDEITEESGIDF